MGINTGISHSMGTAFSSKVRFIISSISGWRSFSLSISLFILSMPGALPFESDFTATFSSVMEKGLE